MTGAIHYTWNGETMVPLPRHAKRCDERFVVGEVYPLEIHEERSWKSHGHYFACIKEAWQSLPEKIAERFPTSEHLRKWALMKAGYRNERTLVVDTNEEALRVAAFMKPADEFAVFSVDECVITEYTAKSQSTRAMGKKEFQESKDKVLDVIAALLEVDRGDLEAAA